MTLLADHSISLSIKTLAPGHGKAINTVLLRTLVDLWKRGVSTSKQGEMEKAEFPRSGSRACLILDSLHPVSSARVLNPLETLNHSDLQLSSLMHIQS
jgi:hypothetical protein